MSLAEAKRDALVSWAASIRAEPHEWRLNLNNRLVTSGAWSIDSLVHAIETASSLNGAARTFVVLAVDSAGDELARTDVRVDPKELARTASAEIERDTRAATATAQVIAATDHKAVSSAFKANSDALSESHNALIKMVAAFGDAGGSMMKANVEVIKTLDARAASDAQRIANLEIELRAEKKRGDTLEDMVEKAIAEAERLKQEQRDFVLMARATFGDKVDDFVKAFAANASAPREVPQ